jgi:hypothetical protein
MQLEFRLWSAAQTQLFRWAAAWVPRRNPNRLEKGNAARNAGVA